MKRAMACFIFRSGSVLSLLLLLAVGCFITGCSTSGSRIESTLSHYKAGDDEAPLIKELHLAGQPSFFYPNLPAGEEMIDYFLPEGNVRVSTRLTDNGRVVLSSDPFFIEDRTPIADRVKKYNQTMDDYVKKLKLK
jgi:hypothetical protein